MPQKREATKMAATGPGTRRFWSHRKGSAPAIAMRRAKRKGARIALIWTIPAPTITAAAAPTNRR